MTNPEHGVKRAFLAASARTYLQVLKEELRQRGVEPLTAFEQSSTGHSILERVQQGIARSDLVVAVIAKDQSDSDEGTARLNVFLELGIAYGLSKNVLILLSPSYKSLPSDLIGQLCVRVEPSNREAIAFALDQFLAGRAKSQKRKGRRVSLERPLGQKVDRYLRRLSKSGSKLTGNKLVELVVDVLKASGVTALAEQSAIDRGADIAAWSDDLQAAVGNPLIIEVKSSLQNDEQLELAFEQIELYRQNSNSQWALLLAPTISSRVLQGSETRAVLSMAIPDLLEKLRRRTFSEVIREARNALVHGGAA